MRRHTIRALGARIGLVTAGKMTTSSHSDFKSHSLLLSSFANSNISSIYVRLVQIVASVLTVRRLVYSFYLFTTMMSTLHLYWRKQKSCGLIVSLDCCQSLTSGQFWVLFSLSLSRSQVYHSSCQMKQKMKGRRQEEVAI